VTFSRIFSTDELHDAVSNAAWLQAMLDFERALADAEARTGVIPVQAADVIARACAEPLAFDVERARRAGNPAEPLVAALRQRVGGDAAGYVHWGATSQDVMDTAAMLVSKRALALVLAELDGVAAECARLAREHRGTIMAARTLLLQAVPTTFGAKAAGWLVAVVEARGRLQAWRPAVELGGAAGTLAALGDGGLDVLRRVAETLELDEPVVPWHANRVRVAELGGALDVAAGATAKIATDVALLAQNEVGEVREPAGSGGSSTMPHKRNPIGSSLAVACAEQVRGCASVLSAALVQEHERGLAWQAEWGPLSQALALTGGAAGHVRGVLEGLEVDAGRMHANMVELIGAEHASFLLAPHVGRERAHERVGAAARGGSFRDGLVAAGLSEEEADRALDPSAYLGAAEAFVDRALVRYEARQ
jgi:3-carboxy-cis,cis-muconate cycloisomerase